MFDTQSIFIMCEQHRPMCHLHLHTSYSRLDGAGKIENYIELAKEYNHPAITVLDHGNMSGTFEFFQKCKDADIKPILGMEAYLNDEIGKHEERKNEGRDNHQTIIIKNKEGFVNLNKLTYLSFTEGYYRKGRITTDWLVDNKTGLIISTNCLAGKLSTLIQQGKEKEAEDELLRLKNEFGDDFLAEIQLNEVGLQKTYNEFIIRMSKKHNIMPVMTGDVHYAYPEDNRLQDVLIAINESNPVGQAFSLDARHLNYHSAENFYELNKKFGFNYDDKFITECIDNTLKVMDKCQFELDTGTEKYPQYEPTQDVIDFFKTDETKGIITKLAHAKLNQKLKAYQANGLVNVTTAKLKEYRDRLNYELEVIDDKKMLDYFLVVWELMRFCKDNDIATGPGRGSAAGSLLSWCLDITQIDPIRFGLYFERFLNPERKGPPDIDIDFEKGSDDKTFEFLIEKYGKERVFPVITFGTFNEKGCIKDVARALGHDAGFSSDVFAVTSEMPKQPVWDCSLEEWLREHPKSPECSERVRRWILDPDNKEILDLTLKLQGQIRSWGKHAGGIVITPGPVWESIPVNITKGVVVTAFQESSINKDLSTLGILKLDRLKLETLNVIKDAVKLIKEKKGVDISEQVDNINLEDPNLFKELMLGNNHGIFQFESDGMNALLKGIKVDKFSELVAANALFRPGPMGIGADQEFIKNKFSSIEHRKYAHPSLIPLLEETNGVLVFQEQLMFIAHEIGGLSLGEGDNLRKVMDSAGKIINKTLQGEPLTDKEKSDKKYKSYLELWGKFKEGAKQKGLTDKEVQDIEEWLIQYLGYSFNKSHSLCYSYVAMRTLFLKHYYPTEFYTALLNHPKTSNKKDKEKQWMSSTILAAMAKGIKIVPPTRQSNWEWTMIDDKTIAMGFSKINGMGEVAYAELKENNIGSMDMEDFFSTKFKKFNKTSFENCLKAGLFDDWSKSHDELRELRKMKLKNVKQLDLFGNTQMDVAKQALEQKFSPTSDEERKNTFMEVCGIDLELMGKISNMRETLLKTFGNNVDSALNFSEEDKHYYFLIEKIDEKSSKRGTKYYQLTIGDGGSNRKINMWSEMYRKLSGTLKEGDFYVTKFQNDKGWMKFDENADFQRIEFV